MGRHGGSLVLGQKSRLCSSKARNKASFQPVSCQLAFVVKGGFGSGKPHAVDTVEFSGDHFVKMHKLESWVCHTVAGKAKGLNPLRRTRALDNIADKIAEAVEEKTSTAHEPAVPNDVHDCMADLGLDAPSAFAPARQMKTKTDKPMLQQGRSRAKKSTGKPKAAPVECKVLSVLMGDNKVLRVLTRPPHGRRHRSHAWVHAADVPWVLELLHRQWVTGGVDFSPEPSRQRKPYFQIRDRSWQVRARLPSGEYKRKSFVVPWSRISPDGKRSFLSVAQFARDKEAMFHKAVAWQEAMETGLEDPTLW